MTEYMITRTLTIPDQDLAKQMICEILLAEKPCVVIRQWRLKYNIKQRTVAKKLNVSSSVISDYESGRRKSPGIAQLKKLIFAIIELKSKK